MLPTSGHRLAISLVAGLHSGVRNGPFRPQLMPRMVRPAGVFDLPVSLQNILVPEPTDAAGRVSTYLTERPIFTRKMTAWVEAGIRRDEDVHRRQGKRRFTGFRTRCSKRERRPYCNFDPGALQSEHKRRHGLMGKPTHSRLQKQPRHTISLAIAKQLANALLVGAMHDRRHTHVHAAVRQDRQRRQYPVV